MSYQVIGKKRFINFVTMTSVSSATLLSSACGLKNNANVDRRNSSPQSAALILQKSAQLELSGSLVDLDTSGPINLRNYSLVSKFMIPSLDPTDENFALLNDYFPPVKVRITDGSGLLLWEKTENFREIKWDVPLAKSGEITVTVEALGNLPSPNIDPVKPWTKKFTTDFDAPKISLTPVIDPPNDQGDRPLRISVLVLGEKGAQCPTAQVQHLGDSTPQEVSLKAAPSAGQTSSEKLMFTGEVLIKAKDLKGTPLVIVSCRDLAGNTAEVREPARPTATNFTLALDVKGPKGPFVSEGNSIQVVYLQKPELNMDLQLVDVNTGTFIPSNLVDIYKENLLIYLTDKSPESLADINENKGLLWSQKYERSLAIKLSPLLSNLQIVYVSMVFKDQISGKDILASTLKVPLFMAKSAPSVSIVSTPKLTKPELNRPLDLVATIKSEGAPIGKEGINVELSTDGIKWTMVPSTTKVDKETLILTFNYPYAVEMPVRARVSVTDLAGYRSVSNTSGLLAGFDPGQLAVEAKDRDMCKDKGSGGALLKPWLVSKYLCRKSNGNDGLSSTPYAVLLMQNRGAVAPQFYETSFQKKGLGYKVFVNGSEAGFYRIEPSTEFTLDPMDQRLFHLPLNPEWLKSDLVEIRMDLEATDVNSTTNSCYLPQKPYTSVVIQDKASALVPVLDAFACSADQRL